MALFHLSVTQTKRSAGQSAIASAAYRAGERLYSEYYGEYSDYTRKGGVICSDILLPSHAPPEFADRQTLWNAVEKAERGKNAQLAYSFDIALQNEFSLEENIALARQFLLENFVSRGMVVDFAVHQPDREDGGIPNPHFHVLCPIRPIEQNGKWGLKQRRVYELDEDGNRIRDQNGEFVFNAVPTTDWGSPETLEHWREAWAEMCNAKFAEKGIDVRIDHRSYERQGVDLLPTTVVNMAPTRQRLENDVFTVGGIAQKYNCALKRLDWQQEQGFVSSLALGYNEVEIQRGMTTSSTAIFIPFMTRELRMDGQALYYGMNALSHNVIMADRKKLKSANGMYLGSTGSGKSFAAKRELLNVFLTIPQDRIIIVDPMGEYAPLVRRLGGQVIEIAPDSPHHLNPMDVELNMAAGESPLSMKADFLLSLCELVVGGKEGLQPIEKTVVDRCVRLVYREQALGLDTGKTPLLQDLYEELLKQPEPEARRVATALELYCTGSLNLFNHPTNVKTDSRVVCIVLKNMGENLRKIAMHITNEFVSQAVDTNFREGVATWCYFDEFHVLLRDPLTASYFVAVWKMLRKKGCVPSALTQNVKDLLASREIENILDNTDFMILLSQAQSDRAILARQLGISEHQLSYITHSNSGEGLLFYGNVTIPFVDRFPKGEIYDLLTTRPEDMKNEAKTE